MRATNHPSTPGAATKAEQAQVRETLQRGVALQCAGLAELRLIALLERARALKARLHDGALDEAELQVAVAEATALALATAGLATGLGMEAI